MQWEQRGRALPDARARQSLRSSERAGVVRQTVPVPVGEERPHREAIVIGGGAEPGVCLDRGLPGQCQQARGDTSACLLNWLTDRCGETGVLSARRPGSWPRDSISSPFREATRRRRKGCTYAPRFPPRCRRTPLGIVATLPDLRGGRRGRSSPLRRGHPSRAPGPLARSGLRFLIDQCLSTELADRLDQPGTMRSMSQPTASLSGLTTSRSSLGFLSGGDRT